MIQEANERSWQEYWEEARRPGEWVDYIFIQVPGILLVLKKVPTEGS